MPPIGINTELTTGLRATGRAHSNAASRRSSISLLYSSSILGVTGRGCRGRVIRRTAGPPPGAVTLSTQAEESE